MNQKNPMGLLKSIKNIDNICIHWFVKFLSHTPYIKNVLTS